MAISASIIGLGKLGACMAAAMASRGVRTIGVDVKAATVEKVQQKLAPVYEPGLDEMMISCDSLLSATTDMQASIHETQITFVVVPTPSNEEGAFSLEHVRAAVESIGRALHDKAEYHTVVVTSTVLPGSTEYFAKPLLERVSGKRCGQDFGLCYSPEFIALGSVLRDFLNPDFVLIGECDSRAGDQLEAFYREMVRIDARAVRMTPVNAELAKIALNTFVTTKITFANMLAEICEQLPGGDVDAVTSALGLDRRIGPKYLKGALGYGGPCFPRDNSALVRFLEEMGVSAQLPRAVDQMNRRQTMRIASMIEQLNLGDPRRVAVLGLAYKPDTNVVEESQGVAIARLLAQKGFRVSVYDPVAMEPASRELGHTVEYGDSIADCVRGAQAIVIATDWPDFRLVAYQLANSKPRPLILDGWRMLRSSSGSTEIAYRGIGIGYPQRDLRERLRRFIEKLGQPTSAPGVAYQAPIGKVAAG
ncbi:MAG: nucleotide sugar dehydrogenase [Candidatus Acidiferrales bacterium]